MHESSTALLAELVFVSSTDDVDCSRATLLCFQVEDASSIHVLK